VVADLVLLGLGIALQPFRLSGFILILSSKGGTRKGLGFVLGWLACLVLVIAVVVLVTGGRPVRFHTLPATVVQIAKLALGIALIVMAALQSRKRGRPRILTVLLTRLDTMSPWTAAVIAAIVQPWTLVAAGAVTRPRPGSPARGTTSRWHRSACWQRRATRRWNSTQCARPAPPTAGWRRCGPGWTLMGTR
jgi:hypothetical protein